jgi:hypothetical protein
MNVRVASCSAAREGGEVRRSHGSIEGHPHTNE